MELVYKTPTPLFRIKLVNSYVIEELVPNTQYLKSYPLFLEQEMNAPYITMALLFDRILGTVWYMHIFNYIFALMQAPLKNPWAGQNYR